MQQRTVVALLVGVLAIGGGGVGVAAASANSGADADEVETPITGDALTSASRAALAATGGGRVTGTEVDDEESTYEVEVTLDDDREVDVQLDDAFVVVGTKTEAAGVESDD